MHDIKWIRDNPDAFDRALARRGLAPRGRAADRARRAPPRRDRASSRPRRRAATPPRRRSARPRRPRTRRAPRELMAEVAELKDAIPALEAEEKSASRRARATRSPQIPNLPLDDVPDGRRRARQCRASPLRSEARLRLRAEAAFRARRGARPDGFRDRREALRRALRGAEGRARAAGARARPVHARPAHRPSTATPRSARRCWCATR